jgi:hypothetical protein
VNTIRHLAILRPAAARLAALLTIVALQPAIADETSMSEVNVDLPGRVARLSYVDGPVSVAPAGSEDWTDAVLNRPLTSGDRLWLDVTARAELEIGSTTMHLDHETGFGIRKLDDEVLLARLTEGVASIRVRSLAEPEAIQVETPNATVRARRAGEYLIEFDPDNDRTIVRARSGEAEVMGGSASHLVSANQEGVFTGLHDLSAQIGPIAPRTAFETWAADRTRREDRSVSSRYVSSDVIGYEDLDDHGDWMYVSSYGYVWRPRQLAYDWAPYRFGRWLWIGPWGWTWVDDARWGFAPFHYGRWVSLHDRWCWVPGPRHLQPVYAPALVGWIGNPPAGFSAFGRDVRWFPLSPHDVYVPGYRHTLRYTRRVNQSNAVIDDAKLTRAANARVRDDPRSPDPAAVTAGRLPLRQDAPESVPVMPRAPAVRNDRERAAAREGVSERGDARREAMLVAPSRQESAQRAPPSSRPASAAPSLQQRPGSTAPATQSSRSGSAAPAPQSSRSESVGLAPQSSRQDAAAGTRQSARREARDAPPTRSTQL